MKAVALLVLFLVVCSAVQPKNMRLRSVRKAKGMSRVQECTECIPEKTDEGIDGECPPGMIGSSGNGCEPPTPTCCEADATSDYFSAPTANEGASAPAETTTEPTCKFTGSTAKCLGPEDADCSKCLGTYDGACVAQWAKYIGGLYNAAGTKYNQPKRIFGYSPVPTHADCSSFVSTVLKAAGYDCFLDGLQYKTTYFYRFVTRSLDTKLPNCGGYHLDKPAVGDLMNWESGTTGHIGIVVEVNGDKIKWAGMGSGGGGKVEGLGKDWEYVAATKDNQEVNMQRNGLGGPAGWAKAGFWSPQKAAAEPVADEPVADAPAQEPAGL